MPAAGGPSWRRTPVQGTSQKMRQTRHPRTSLKGLSLAARVTRRRLLQNCRLNQCSRNAVLAKKYRSCLDNVLAGSLAYFGAIHDLSEKLSNLVRKGIQRCETHVVQAAALKDVGAKPGDKEAAETAVEDGANPSIARVAESASQPAIRQTSRPVYPDQLNGKPDPTNRLHSQPARQRSQPAASQPNKQEPNQRSDQPGDLLS